MRSKFLSYIRNIEKNDIFRKVVPYALQVKLRDIFIKSKGVKLRANIVKYFDNARKTENIKVKEAVNYLKSNKNGLYLQDFLKVWFCSDNSGKYFDFNGAKLPDISNDFNKMESLLKIFQDTFMFSCLFDDNYDKLLVNKFDPFMMEGPYGYSDNEFDVTVKENDVVIDAGAWIGDFSAYAASKGAIAYAFEPVSRNFELLEKTANLNSYKLGGEKGVIYPINKGLGDKEHNLKIYINEKDSAGNSIYLTKSKIIEEISITTLDKFIEENYVNKLDFIKSDIEGGELDLLKGATNVLKKFAPKLAICSYHSPKDPALLEQIILEANPRYKVIHTRQKLFAWAKENTDRNA